MKMDALTRRILAAHASNPGLSADDLAIQLGVAPDVVVHRLDGLRRTGTIQGVRARVDAAQMGYPYEAFILAVPSSQTTRDELEQLAASPLVTRMFTLATRRSIAFTVLGADPDAAFQRGEDLAHAAHLEDVASVMLVDTLSDDPGGALFAAIDGATESKQMVANSLHGAT